MSAPAEVLNIAASSAVLAMIRRGRTEGWLTLSGEAFRSWADLNDVTFDGTQPGVAPGRGAALIASAAHDAESDDSNALLTVPRDLILSLEKCQEHARVDRDYREVLESLGDFGRVGLSFNSLALPIPSSVRPVYQHSLMLDRHLAAPSCLSYLFKHQCCVHNCQNMLVCTQSSYSEFQTSF